MEFLHTAVQAIHNAEIFYLSQEKSIVAFSPLWLSKFSLGFPDRKQDISIGTNLSNLLSVETFKRISIQLSLITETDTTTSINIPAGDLLFIWSISLWKYELNGKKFSGYCVSQFERSDDKSIISQQSAIEQNTIDFILESVYDGYWDWHIQENYEYMSPRFWQMFGYDPSEKSMDPKEWMSIIFPEDLEIALRIFDKHTKSRGIIPYNLECRYKHKDGHTVYVICKGKVITWNQDGTPNRMIGTHTDVTDLRLAQQENIKLQLEKEKIEDISKLKSNLLAKLSHEIRTPLHGIMGIASIIETSNTLPESRKNATLLLSNCENLLTILTDVLQMCKLDNYSEAKAISSNVNIGELLAKVVGLFLFKAKEKGNSLRAKVDCTANGQKFEIVSCDKDRVSQILFNLVNNAIKFTDAGKIIIGFKITDFTKSDQGEYYGTLNFKVQDTGIGIAKEYHDRIFEPFVQVDSKITRKYSGAGLGLAISLRIVEKLLHGKFSLESSLGNGSCFSFTVPKCRLLPCSTNDISQDHVSDRTGSVEENQDTITPRWDKQFFQAYKERISPISVLIVDDNRMNLFILKNVLKTFLKFAPDTISVVDQAENGKIAVGKCKEKNYDIIFMDLHMPEMDGFDASRNIRNFERAFRKDCTPCSIVAVTADSFLDTKNICLECGMNSFLSKPFKKEEIYLLLTQKCVKL